MKKLFLVFIIGILFLTLTVNAAPKKWTVMVFINGDNNLEGAGIKDINEMEKIGSSDQVNIVVQYDRIPGYDSSNGDWKGTKIFYIEKDNDFQKISSKVVKDLGEVDMGDYKEAIKFFNYSVDKYPAERYLFVYWNHGMGWEKENRQERLVKGISYDDTNGTHIDSPGMKKVAEAMYSKLGRKMDVIAFDACLMGMIEVAMQQSDYLKYMIASEETEPGDGWPYDLVLGPLVKNPNMKTVDFTKTAVKAYLKSYEGQSSWWGPTEVTQGAMDLSKIPALAEAVDDMASYVYKNLDKEKSSLDHAINYSQKYELSYSKDLYNFVERLKAITKDEKLKVRCDKVLKAIKDAVIITMHQGDKMKDSHGIAIYAPKKYEWKKHYINTEFAKATAWDEMLLKSYDTQVQTIAQEPADEDVSEPTVAVNEEPAAEPKEDNSPQWWQNIVSGIKDFLGLFRNRSYSEVDFNDVDALASHIAKEVDLNGNGPTKPPVAVIRKLADKYPELNLILEKMEQ